MTKKDLNKRILVPNGKEQHTGGKNVSANEKGILPTYTCSPGI